MSLRTRSSSLGNLGSFFLRARVDFAPFHEAPPPDTERRLTLATFRGRMSEVGSSHRHAIYRFCCHLLKRLYVCT